VYQESHGTPSAGPALVPFLARGVAALLCPGPPALVQFDEPSSGGGCERPRAQRLSGAAPISEHAGEPPAPRARPSRRTVRRRPPTGCPKGTPGRLHVRPRNLTRPRRNRWRAAGRGLYGPLLVFFARCSLAARPWAPLPGLWRLRARASVGGLWRVAPATDKRIGGPA